MSYTETVKVWKNWLYQLPDSGTLSSDKDITPTEGDKALHEMIFNSLDATSSDTLTIYKDSKTSGNKIFDGKFGNRDFDGAVKFNKFERCTTKWIIVTGGSGSYYVTTRYR